MKEFSSGEMYLSLEKKENIEPIDYSERIIERSDGFISEKLLNYRQFMQAFFGDINNESRSNAEKTLPVLESEIKFKDRTTGNEIKFNDLLPKGWKIILSGENMDRIWEFPKLEGMSINEFRGSFDGIRECANLSNNINCIHYNTLESNEEGFNEIIIQDITALLHEIGHAHQKDLPIGIEYIHSKQKICNFILENKPTRSSSFMINQELGNFIAVNPAYFGIYGYENSQKEYIRYAEVVYIPLQLIESLIQSLAAIEKDAHDYAIKKILELRKNGINVEGSHTIEEVYQFQIAALNTYNRSYSELLGRQITFFTDSFELNNFTN